MGTLGQLALIALGGGLGAVARHLVGVAAIRFIGFGFPWGTLIVNVTGSFLMGLLVTGLLRFDLGQAGMGARLFLATGFLGGFTTFSTFSLDAALLWERGETGAALAYVSASLVLSLAGIAAGLALGRALHP